MKIALCLVGLLFCGLGLCVVMGIEQTLIWFGGLVVLAGITALRDRVSRAR